MPQMSGSRKPGCKPCRERHTRCDRGLPACSACKKASIDRQCVYEGIKIRQSSYSANYPAGNTRSVQIPTSLDDHVETLPTTQASITAPAYAQGPFWEKSAAQDPSKSDGTTGQQFTYLQTVISPSLPETAIFSHPAQTSPISSNGRASACSWDESEFNHAHRRRRLSSFTSNAGYSASARRMSREGSNRLPITGEKDSRIFQFYIENAGPWLDIVSPARHFGQTVPRLALTEPVLFYACLAYASHVMSLMNKVDKTSEETYQSQAIGLLIPLLDSREQPWTDEVLLATAVILRMSEQFSEVAEDAQHHLNGAFSLFGTSGQKWSPFNTGLRGIAFWIYLRESIRVCFLFEQACRFDMSLIEDYAFEQAPDEVWSNRMTYLLARTCNACWGSAVVDGEGEMVRINSVIDAWRRGLPSTFLPWSTSEGDGPFPTIRVLSTWHLIGWQQYYAAKVMLAVHSKLSYPAGSFLDHNRYMQREVLEPARHLCGLCFSCDDIGSAINGSHLTAWCGQFLTGADEQRTLVSELDALMEKTTWPNKTCSRKLRRIWKGEQQGWADTG